MEARQKSSRCQSGKLLGTVPGPFKKAKPSMHARASDARTLQGKAPSCRQGRSKARIGMICHSGMFLRLLGCPTSAWTGGPETLYMGGLKQRTGEIGCTPLRRPIQGANGLQNLKTFRRSHATTQVNLPSPHGGGSGRILLPKSEAGPETNSAHSLSSLSFL